MNGHETRHDRFDKSVTRLAHPPPAARFIVTISRPQGLRFQAGQARGGRRDLQGPQEGGHHARHRRRDGAEGHDGHSEYSIYRRAPNSRTEALTDVSRRLGGSPSSLLSSQAHYSGKLANGTDFDSSRKRGKPFQFVIGIGRESLSRRAPHT